MAETAPELMTVKETAEYLRIPLPTVYYLVQRGQLPAVQIGGRWRIKTSTVTRLREDITTPLPQSIATRLRMVAARLARRTSTVS